MESPVLGHHLEVVDCDTADDCNHGCPCEDNICNYDECDDYIGCMTSLDCDGCPCGEDHICKYDECPRVGKAFSLLPQYLSVPRFKLCVGYKNVGTSTEVCLPRTKPETCTSESWIELRDQNELGSCEENKDGCMTSEDCDGCPCENNICVSCNVNRDGCMTSEDCDGCPCEHNICASCEENRDGCMTSEDCDGCPCEYNICVSCEENRDGCLTSEDCDGCPCEHNICVSCEENRDGCMSSEDCDGCPCEHNICVSCDESTGDFSPAPVKMDIVEYAIGHISVDLCGYHLIHGKKSVHDFESQVVDGTKYRFVVYVRPRVGPSVGDTCKQLRCEFTVFEPLPGRAGIHVSEEHCLYL